MKIESLKSVPAGYINTPLEPMPRLAAALGLTGTAKFRKTNDTLASGLTNASADDSVNTSEAALHCGLYIKRDDMTGLALGGNKARKLNYIVKYALDNGYTALMTFGGVQTNHGRLTAAAAIRYGLKPILVLKGKKPDYLSGNLLLDRLMGADIYFVDTSSADALPEAEQAAAKQRYVDECAARIIAEYEARGDKVLSVPVGGQTVIGSAGYIQAVPEIMAQMNAQNIRAKHLVVGYGSTGTFAGLWAGAKYYHAPFEVIGIPIEPDCRPVEETVDFINELSEYFEMGFTCRREDLHLELGFDPAGSVPADSPAAGYGSDPNVTGHSSSDVTGHSSSAVTAAIGGTVGQAPVGYGGVGYNEPDAVTESYIELLARTEAIFVDPCYTGKVLHGYVDLLKRGVIRAEDGAIFMHTGGAPGLWTREHLDHMQEGYWSDEEKDHVHTFKL